MDITITKAAATIGINATKLRRLIEDGTIKTTTTRPVMKIDQSAAIELRDLITAHGGDVRRAVMEYHLRRRSQIQAFEAARLIGVARTTVVGWCIHELVPGASADYGDYLVPAALVTQWIHTNAQYSAAATRGLLGIRSPKLAELRESHWLRSSDLPNGRRFYDRRDVDLLVSALATWSRFEVLSVLRASAGVLLALSENEGEEAAEIDPGDRAEATRLRRRRSPELLTILLRHRRELIAETTDLG